MHVPRGYHLSKVVLAFLLIICIVYGRALLTSAVLSQADVLLTLSPWKDFQPKGFAVAKNPLLSDQSLQVIPNLYYLKHALSERRIPLWNPHIMAGMPFLANMQSAVFFPIQWLVLLMPVPVALEWISATKILLSALGFYLFCLKGLGVRPLSAFGGAVAYAFCGFNTVWLFYPLTNVTLLSGWLLLSIHLVITRGQLKQLLLLALVVALAIFAGHPETVLHLLVMALIFIIFALRHARVRPWPAIWKLCAAVALGVALSSVALVPFVQAGLSSATLAGRRIARPGLLPWFSGITIVIPNFFGNPVAGFYRGPINYNEICAFTSVSSLALAGLALAFARRNVGTYFGLSVAFLCGMVAYGIRPISTVFYLLPFYADSLNSRMILGVSLGLAVLTATGLNAIFDVEGAGLWRRVRQRTTSVAVMVALLLGPFIAARLVDLARDKTNLEYLSAQVIWFFVTIAALLGLLTWLIQHPEQRRWVCFFWVVLICVEMIHFSKNYNPAIDRARYAYDYLPESIRFLQSRGIERYVGVNYGELASNSSMVYGIFDFRGYDFPETAGYGEYFYRLVDGSSRSNLTHSINNWTADAIRALGWAGVRYFVHSEQIQYPGMKLVHSDGMKIYEYEQAVPRVYLPRNVIEVPTNQDALSRMKAPDFDARTTAFVAMDNDGVSLPRESPSDASVTLVSYHPEAVSLEARSSAPAVVVLTDTAVEGWHAYVNGIPAKVHTANGMFRAVATPAGISRVEFKYEPGSYAIGKLLSLSALAAMLLGLVWTVVSANRS